MSLKESPGATDVHLISTFTLICYRLSIKSPSHFCDEDIYSNLVRGSGRGPVRKTVFLQYFGVLEYFGVFVVFPKFFFRIADLIRFPAGNFPSKGVLNSK